MSPLFDLVLLFPLFIIGGICTYTDVKYGKIFNKWIVIGFFWGISFSIFLFFYNYFFLFQISNIKYLIEVGINGLIAFLVGYLLWHLKLWSAGDAKFFALCAFLLPLKFYSKSYLPYFPSFNLLVNLFVPLLLVLTAAAFFQGIKELYNNRAKLKNIKNLDIKELLPRLKILAKKFLQLFLSYIFISVFFQRMVLLKEFVPGLEFLFNPFFLFLSMFVIYGFLSKIELRIKWISYFIKGTTIAYCSFLLFFGRAETLKSILKQALIFLVLITLFRQVLNFYIEKKEVKEVQIKDLQKGAVVSNQDISGILKQLRDRKKEKEFGKMGAEGLNKKQAIIIKNLFAGKPDLKIRIYKTFPFTPFMLLSVLISILTKSSLLASSV